MKLKKVITGKALPCLVLILSVAGIVMYNAARATWVFVDIAVKINNFTLYLLYAMILNVIAVTVLAAIRLYEPSRKGSPVYSQKSYFITTCISAFFSIFFFIVAVVFFVVMAGRESSGVYFLYLKKSLFDVAFFVLVPFTAIFFPTIKGKARKAVLAVILAVTFTVAVFKIFPVTKYEITCAPTVFDNGKEYSVVFSTSDCGTGYIEYTFEGQKYKLYDENGGRLNSDSQIHSISVPYEHLNNNTYKIGSVRVIEQYSYGSRTGKEVVSEEYIFSPVTDDNATFLVISDWHTEIQKVYETVSHMGSYDALILMGDASPGVDFEEEVVRNIVEFSGELSNGTMPVLFVRGNHETRGEYAGKLLSALGLESFYYTANIANCSFIVLDSGEDKDDSHPEYGGMTDYNTYRANMIKWLKTVELENERVIALSHSWEISDVEPELSQEGWNQIDRLGAKLMISGHSHECRLLGTQEKEQEMLSAHPGITGYMDGGNSDDAYIASKMTVSPEYIFIEAYNNNGENVLEHTIQW